MDPSFGIATGAYEPERDDWIAAIGRARHEGWPFIELTAFGDARVDLLANVDPRSFAPFDRVSLHAPVRGGTPDELLAQVLALPFDWDVVLHPDVYREAESVSLLGGRAVFENMDVAKDFGRSVEDVAEVLERFPHAAFCLDVAHVWTNDATLALGHELLDAFGARLRQVHASGIEPDGTHRETTETDLQLYRPLLDRCRSVPWLLETVIAT